MILDLVKTARGHLESGLADAAEIYYRAILKETEALATGIDRLARGEACMWFARKAVGEGLFGTAADWYLKATLADPLAVEYRVEYCIRALIPNGLFRMARIEAERATRIDPLSKEAWRCLGAIEMHLGNPQDSVDAYEKQLALDPYDPNARLDRATIAVDLGDYVKVREMCAPVLSTERAADAKHALAMAAYREADHERAIELYDEAIAGGCHDAPMARWHKSLALHSIGRYREGWAEHEQRGKQKTEGGMALVFNRFRAPSWAGEPPSARLHVHQEMGHGDALAMARYLPLLQQRGYEVCLEVNDSLVALMAHSLPGIRVIAKAVDYPGALGVPAFDYHIPMLSLPHLMGTDVDTIPWQGPYLRADPELAGQYRQKLPEGTNIGLCWSAGIRTGLWINQYGSRKSMHFDTLQPILKMNRSFVSLQVGPEREQLKGWAAIGVHDVLPPKPTWAETTALIECLDLVVTVDTGVAHLAGAMGKETWLLAQRDCASWHFMCWRPGAPWNERSPWYPTMRIFRQHEFNCPHYWDEVVADVVCALRMRD